MNLDQQLPTLRQCKGLKDYGFPQDCYFSWRYETDRDPFLQLTEALPSEWGRKMDSRYYAAPTLSELGQVLPTGCATEKLPNGNFICGTQILAIEMPTEAQAKAEYLLHLLSTKKLILPG